jgi:hypothetical protein
MALDLVDYEQKAREAVKAFWGNREAARQKQIEAGKADQGERAGVTAGKNMDGFLALVLDIIKANGLAHAEIHQNRAMRRPRHNQCWHLNAYRVARPR